MSRDDDIPEEIRRAATRSALYYKQDWWTMLVGAALLSGYGVVLSMSGADTMLLVFAYGFATLLVVVAIYRWRQSRGWVTIARHGRLEKAVVRQVHRRPGDRGGDPNEYALLLQVPGSSNTETWVRARFTPEQARALFGCNPPPRQPIAVEGVSVPVLVMPERPGQVLLGV